MDFQTVEEVKSKSEMTQSLKWLKRMPRPANFLFKHSCEELEKQPLLLLASPGGKVNRSLAEQLKGGSRSVWGQVRRRGADLLFITRGRANQGLMVRKLIQLGNEHGVPLKRKNLMVITESEGRALMAVERSVRRLRRSKKPVGFVFKGRVDALGGGPALLLKRGGTERHVRALGSGGLVEGTVVVADGKTTFTVTSGSVSPTQMIAQLKRLGRESRALLRKPVVLIGEGGAQPAADVATTSDGASPARQALGSTPAGSPAPIKAVRPVKAASPPSSPASSARESALEATRRKIAEAQQRAEASRRKAKEKAERQEQERQAREAAEAERQEQERQERQERERREQERAEAERARKQAALPALQRRHARALGAAEDAAEEVAQAEAARAREEKVFGKKNLRRFEDVEALVDAIIALQDELTSESGKPDKDLRQLMRDLQREDDIDDAVDEVMEWFEERKEDLDEELDELRKESQVLQKKVTELATEIEDIENS